MFYPPNTKTPMTMLAKCRWLIALATICMVSCTAVERGENQTEEATPTAPEVHYEYGIAVDTLWSKSDVVRSGETLSAIFERLGCTKQMVHELNFIPTDTFNARQVRQGHNYTAYYSSDSALRYVVYHESVVNHVVFTLGEKLAAHRYRKQVRRERKCATAKITSSLWNATLEAGLHPQVASELSDVYAWTIDFFGLQVNDSFAVCYDELYVDTLSIGVGAIHAARFTHRGKEFLAFNYKSETVDGYWDEEGNSLRKAFLKAPLKFSRISSGFTYARKHPIYKTVRPHTGVDYAAPAGTPVMSIGDGVVVEKGYKGGGGHTVKIRHNSVYTTAYLHLSRYAQGLQVGKRVAQGEVIGYVGSTGASTGPHLDFRVWKNGSPINPLTMESPSVEPVPKAEMEAFASVRDSLLTLLP